MKIKTENLSFEESKYLASILAERETIQLEGLWSLMDAAWAECGCNANVIDERINKFYQHPVWLLNGIFIEQDELSMKHRRVFSEYIAGLKPKRVADFGGGYGTLARMIAACCPEAEVHIVEPHPHKAAVEITEKIQNLRYVSDFHGEYDVIIATDVFEHVPDPLALVESTSYHLRVGGKYLIANCFWPVIKCHLPSTFHFRWTWDKAMTAMNLLPGQAVSYGRAYERLGPISASAAREIESRSSRWFELIEKIPGRIRVRVANILLR